VERVGIAPKGPLGRCVLKPKLGPDPRQKEGNPGPIERSSKTEPKTGGGGGKGQHREAPRVVKSN